MKRHFTRILLTINALFLSLFGFFGIGKSDWIITKVSDAGVSVTTDPVCYNTTTNVYYTKVETALDQVVSGQTIMVIPGTDPVITRDCTIKSGVTLRLPYDVTVSDDSMKGDSGSGDPPESTNKNCVKLTVTLDKNVTLTNNGTLQISGVLTGGGGGYSAGYTKTSWANLSLRSGAKLIQNSSSATTYCYGFIVEETENNGSNCEFNNGKVYLPFIVRDFKGGSTTYGIYKASNGCFPFNQYETRNIEPLSTFRFGSEIWGMANLYAGSQANATQMKMLGSNSSSFFQLSDGSYMQAKRSKNEVTDIKIYGSVTTNAMQLSVKAGISMTIKSSDYVFGVSYRYQLHFLSASGSSNTTVTVNQKYKFLPGSSLEVGEGVTFNADWLVFYDKFDDATYSGNTPYPKDKAPAYFVNNGTSTINTLAGYVRSDVEGKTLKVSTGNSITTQEAKTSEGSSIFASCTFMEITNSLTFDYYNDTTETFDFTKKQTEIPKGNYTSIKDNNSKAGYKYVTEKAIIRLEITNATITLTINGTTTSYSSSTQVSVPLETSVTYSVTYSQTENQATTVTKPDGTTVSSTSGTMTMTGNATIKATSEKASSGGGCFAKGTRILLPNNTYKKVEELSAGDTIMAFDHISGSLVESSVFALFHLSSDTYPSLYLNFDNGTQFHVIFGHSFFSLDTMRYEEIRTENVNDYIGQRFVTFENGIRGSTTLVSYEIKEEEQEVYTIVSDTELNCIAEGLLNFTDDFGLLVNIFDVDADLKYMNYQSDIATYGLYTFADFDGTGLNEGTFDAFGMKYLKISVGKGYITYDNILEAIAAWKYLIDIGALIQTSMPT